MRKLIVAILRFYKWAVSPLLAVRLPLLSTCSDYMRQAVESIGAARGVWMGLKRLLRCHPFHAGGLDPVR